MHRLIYASFAALMMTLTAQAHFVFVVPAANGSAVSVVFSDSLEPDENVAIEKIAALKLTVRNAANQDTAVTLKTDKHALTGSLPGTGPRVVYGSIPYGVLAKGGAAPYLLTYHPKAIVGPVAERAAMVATPLEVLPIYTGGKIAFQVLATGKPVADAEVTVTGPDDKKEKVKTGPTGITQGFAGEGRFAVFAKNVEAKEGEHDGKKYSEIRHYATLVLNAVPASPYPPLPVAASSLGAIAADGYLYVYGGHAGKTHSYDTKSVIGTFQRVKLDGGTKWEELPGGPILQGMNLAAHNGKIYRVGGMQPRNAPGEPTDNISLTDVARFDPKVGKWEALPALPAGRSSHDVVVAGDKLVVVGGWEQTGKGGKSTWHDTALTLDLAAKDAKWQSIPQPFKRRALTAAAIGSKVYVLGGLAAEGTDKRSDILDVETGKWSTGPELPGSERVAFSPAATTVNGKLIVNTSAGPVYRLASDGARWEKVGEALKPRMVARLVPLGPDAVVLVGGASRSGNVDLVEIVKLATTGEPVAASK